MIYIFSGEDFFSRKETLDGLREAVGPEEVREANISTLDCQRLTPAQLQATCLALPFLAQRRLVIVEGLLALSEERELRRNRGREEAKGEESSWAAALQQLSRELPPTTDLVLLEERLSMSSALLQKLRPLAQLREFPALTGAALRQWITQRGSQKGVKSTPNAVRLLADLVGPDLWAQENELEKLSLFCNGRVVTEADVAAVTAPFREVSIFQAVDAVLEKDAATATRLISGLIEGGAAVPYIITMLGRQVRLLLLCQELQAQGCGPDEIGHRLGLRSAFPLRKTMEQAQRFSREKLLFFFQRLVETDLATKTGALGETLALETLLAELASFP